LESLKLDSIERVDNLETLKEIVLTLEDVAAKANPAKITQLKAARKIRGLP
jgi:hypothetical protein